MKKYKVIYVTSEGVKLTYTVDDYETVNGAFIRFTDRKTKDVKLLPLCNVELSEKENEQNHKT